MTIEERLASVVIKGADTVKFDDLDLSVRRLLAKILKNHVNVILGDSESYDFIDKEDLRRYMAGLMFKGYLIGRKFCGKEREILIYSLAEDEVEGKFKRLEDEFDKVNVLSLLEKAGEPVSKFLMEYSAYEAERGLAGKVEEDSEALTGVYRAILNGFIIAMCEYDLWRGYNR